MAFERYHIGGLMGNVYGNDITYLFVALKKIECFCVTFSFIWLSVSKNMHFIRRF